jgi:hypothetical protein
MGDDYGRRKSAGLDSLPQLLDLGPSTSHRAPSCTSALRGHLWLVA